MLLTFSFFSDGRYEPEELPIPELILRDWNDLLKKDETLKQILSDNNIEDFKTEKEQVAQGLIINEEDIQPTQNTINNAKLYAAEMKEKMIATAKANVHDVGSHIFVKSDI